MNTVDKIKDILKDNQSLETDDLIKELETFQKGIEHFFKDKKDSYTTPPLDTIGMNLYKKDSTLI